MTNSTGECAVCLESNADLIKLSPCYHKCVCVTCLMKFDVIKGFNCPMCRTTVTNFFFHDQQVIKAISIDSSQLFDALITYISMLSPNCSDYSICENLCSIATSFLPLGTIKTKLQFPLLSVAQANSLLCLAQAKLKKNVDYMTQKAIVSMCQYPWYVDVGLANVGVCYCGNLGEKPGSSYQCLRLICNNWASLRSKNFK